MLGKALSKRAIRGLVLALAVSVFFSCDSGAGRSTPSSGGPLRVNEDIDGEWCLPKHDPGGSVAHGSEVVYNQSDEPVEVLDVQLLDAANFEIVGAYQLPIRGDIAGTLIGWPPARSNSLKSLSEIPPDSQTNLVTHLRSGQDSEDSAIDGLRIDYEAGGEQFVLETLTSVVWKRVC